MGLSTTTPVSLMNPKEQSAGAVKTQASNLTGNARNVQDAASQRLFGEAGAAVLSLQQQIDKIMGVLRGDIPQPSTLLITDPTGNPVAWLGYAIVNNVVYQGGWFKQFYIGGTDAANAVITTDINGNVTISGAEILLFGSSATIVLDPTLGIIQVVQTGGGNRVTISGTGILVDNSTGTPPNIVSINQNTIQLSTNDADAYQINLTGGAGQTLFAPTDTFALSRVMDLYGFSGATANGPIISVTQVRGSGQAPTATQSGDVLGGIVSYGYDGGLETDYTAGIRAVATQNHAAGAHGTELVFSTTQNGTSTPAIGAILDGGGNLAILADCNVAGVYRKSGVPGLITAVTLAKLTALGANGSLTISGGIVTAYTPPT